MNHANHALSIWEITGTQGRRDASRQPTFQHAPLQEHLTTDVCVVGGGITGLTAAIQLQRAGRSVVLLERDRIGAGTSGGTSAHLTNVVDFRYQSLIQSYGLDTARHLARSMTRAIDHIEQLQADLGLDCDFQRVPGFYYAEDPRGNQDVQQEFEAAQQAGLAVQFVERAPLPFATGKAFMAEHQAQFQPMDYLQGLAQALVDSGGRIFEQTNVTDTKDGNPCQITTEHGSVRARHLILATHTPLGINLIQNQLNAFRSYLMAVQVSDEIPTALYWDTADPYHYIRWHKQDGKRFLVVGGKDHKVGRDMSADPFSQLEDYVQRRFQVTEISARWSAQFYDPTDGLPFIGKNLLAQNTYIGTGYSGDGLTFGTLAGLINANLILHGRDEDAGLYQPTRLKLSGAPQTLKKTVQVARHFLGDRLTTGTSSSLERLAPGEGRVVRDGTRYIAACRDQHGELRTFSAICPHMKCVLHWNPSEKSWDCPCHGSRFDTQGQPVDGPAIQGMTPIDWNGRGRKSEPKEDAIPHPPGPGRSQEISRHPPHHGPR